MPPALDESFKDQEDSGFRLVRWCGYCDEYHRRMEEKGRYLRIRSE